MRRGKERRLYERFDRAVSLDRIRIAVAADRATDAVLDRRQRFDEALVAERARAGAESRLLCRIPKSCSEAFAVERLILSGHPREAAHVASGLIPVIHVDDAKQPRVVSLHVCTADRIDWPAVIQVRLP